jgi:hypothetical protein
LFAAPLHDGQVLQQDGINGLSNPNLMGLEHNEDASNELTAACTNNILGEMIYRKPLNEQCTAGLD